MPGDRPPDDLLIAVVDDDLAVATGLQRFLRVSGLRAVIFTSGAEFLASLASAVPDCIVLDVMMPEMNGLAVQARINAAGVTAPVIFLSASDRLNQRRQALAAGAYAFLEKGTDGEVLLEVISSAVRGAGRPSLQVVELLTRSGCGCTNTGVMRGRLEEALRELGVPLAYALIDVSELPDADARRGYPTPTVLHGGVDLFGMEPARPATPAPT